MKKKVEHVLGVVYGQSKTGKTLATVRAFPDGLFVAPPGALTCSKWLDWEPKVVPVTRSAGFKYIIEVVKKAQKNYKAIVIDDLSLLADAELQACKKMVAGFAAFDLFNNRVYDLRDTCREAQCHVFFTCHEQAPREVKKDNFNRYIPGGPLMPGWQVTEKLPAMADFVARVVYDEDAPGWPYLYDTNPDQNYITGDRLAILPGRFPLNLREALLGAGYDLPRPKPLAWMEDHVERISHLLSPVLADPKQDLKTTLQPEGAALIKNNHSQRHVRWVLADALDRAVLRQHNDNLLTSFINSF